MRSATPHPSIPPEALARQARLQAELSEMERRGGNLEAAPLRRLREVLNGRPEGASTPEPAALAAELQAEDLVEEAADLLRSHRRDRSGNALADQLEAQLSPLAAKARQRRSARWQLDTRRLRLRLRFSKLDQAVDFDDGDLHALLLQAFRLEGLRLALDLGKRPRPLLSLGLSLPSGVGSQTEYLDTVLKQEPRTAPALLLERLNQRLPAGLKIHEWTELPACASDLLDLARQAHWEWPVPPHERDGIEARTGDFLRAETWPWERGAAKAEAPLDLRAILQEMRWEGGNLRFSTLLGAWQALNPLKMLGAILGLDPAAIRRLVRTGIDLKPDPRIAQAERFEPKLKNMYEDAVLLGGGSNIILIDEDDDEPIRLG